MTKQQEELSSDDYLAVYKEELDHLRTFQLEHGALSDYYEVIKSQYPDFQVQRFKRHFKNVRSDFLSSINVLEGKFLDQYEQLFSIKVAIDKEKKEIEKLVGIKASAENLLKIDQLASQKEVELEQRLADKQFEKEQELVGSHQKYERKILKLKQISHALDNAYQVLKERYVSFKQQLANDRQEAKDQFQQQTHYYKLKLGNVIDEMVFLFEYYRQYELSFLQKELISVTQIDVRLNLMNQYFFQSKKKHDREFLIQKQRVKQDVGAQQESFETLFEFNQKKFDQQISLERRQFQKQLAYQEAQFADLLKLEQEKFNCFFDQLGSSQTMINGSSSFSIDIQKLYNDLKSKRDSEEALLNKEFTELRSVKLKEIELEFDQKRLWEDQKLKCHYEDQLKKFQQDFDEQCDMIQGGLKQEYELFRQKYQTASQTILELKQNQKETQFSLKELQDYVAQLQKRYEREVYLNRELSARCDQYVSLVNKPREFNFDNETSFLFEKEDTPIILRSSNND